MYELPTSIIIDGVSFHITDNGDYRMILDCFNALEDEELQDRFRIETALIIFYEDINDREDIYKFFGNNVNEAVSKMYDFINCGQKSIGMTMQYKLIDWEQDSQMISAAVNNVAHKEIRSDHYIHWWTFMGYYCSVGESTLSTVVSIRNKIVKGKKLEKHEREFKRENPEYFNWCAKTLRQKEDDELAKQIWNNM